MGRITMPFQQRFMFQLEVLDNFRRGLKTEEDRAAYDAVIHAASFQRGAMANSDIVSVLDAILLSGLVDVYARKIRLEKRIRALEERLNEGSLVRASSS